MIVRFDTTKKIVSEGGLFQNGWVTAKVNGFGTYAIMADTTAPKIQRVSFKNGGWYGAGDIISFKISDDLSGLKTYNGYIDNKWALFEYDSKSDTFFYRLDADRLARSKNAHTLKLYIMDERNNVQTLNAQFYY